MITPAQENERMLARILGIGEDEAAQRLKQRFCVTAGEGEAARFGSELVALLERTITHAPDTDGCDLELVIHAEPRRKARDQLYLRIEPDAVAVSRQPQAQGIAADLHGVQRMIGACYAASVALGVVIDGIAQVSAADPFVIRFDALGATRNVLTTPIRLVDPVLAGAGAVGFGFMRAARYLAISGELKIADPTAVGAGNPNRCLYFPEGDQGPEGRNSLRRALRPVFRR